jgi:hypothetical protein
MWRCFVGLAILLVASAGAAFADPLFTFTITGDGHTFQFTEPNPPTVADHPHDVQVTLGAVTGTVDGVGGYSFAAEFDVVEVDLGQNPVMNLEISPDPPNIGPPYSPYYGDDYRLFGQTFTTLVSDVPNPDPQCYQSVCNDLLTYTYVLGDHPLFGYDPDVNQGPYTLNIAAADATAVTPEPPSLLLAMGGVALAGGLALRRRRVAA